MECGKLKWWPIITVFGLFASASEDIPGAFDLNEVDRFPRSWIVKFQSREESRPHEFIVGPVDKMGQEVRFENSIRTDGEKIRMTYQIPPGYKLVEVLHH